LCWIAFPNKSISILPYSPIFDTFGFVFHDGSEIKFGEPQHNATRRETLAEEDVILILTMVKPNVEIPMIELI